MPTTLTAEQIIALAPDAASAKAGRDLSNPRKWQNLGQTNIAVWGECQGSGKDPYRVQVDLRGPAFRCSCPSRKFPCKHGIALLLMLASQPNTFASAEAPAWVAEWLGKRDQNAQKTNPPPTEATPPSEAKRASQAKSAAAREAKVAAGLDELDRWIGDLIRQGFAAIQGRGYGIWDDMAKRMIDAQAPGLARMVRNLADVTASGDGWQSQLLERLAQLHLLIEAYRRAGALSPEMLAEVRTQIGWAQSQETVLAGTPVRDRWLALGQYVEEEEQLRVQRTWLWGEQTGRTALLLTFAAPGQPIDRSIVMGTALDADLAFYQGVMPLRALIAQRHAPPEPVRAVPAGQPLNDAIGAYTRALTHNPWLERFPLALAEVTPWRDGERWQLHDTADRSISLTIPPEQAWRLLAISGGRPITLFGEWDGATLRPLTVWNEGALTRLIE